MSAETIRVPPPRARAPRRWLRRLGFGLLAIIVLLAGTLAWKPARVSLQTLLLVPSLVGAEPQPLQLFGATPRRETLRYRLDPSAGGDLADLWLPEGASAEHPVGGVVLVLGVNNVGRTYPAVVRFADAMARIGVAVLVPDSAGLLAGRLVPAEIGGVVDAFELIASRREVDQQRIGLVGLSVGGSLALLAAGDTRIANRVRWVTAFGAYAGAGEYLAEVAAHAMVVGGATTPWEPSALTREVFARLLVALVPDSADRHALEVAVRTVIDSGRLPTFDPALATRLSSPEARALYELLAAGSLARARQIVGDLPEPVQAVLASLSPLRHLAEIRADVFLMYDTGDTYVPYGQSVQLANGLRPLGRVARESRFRLFDHVEAKGVDVMAAAPELWKLLWHVQAVLMETL